MKEHGIIFQDENVRAILDGKKTQTRRIVKPQLKHGKHGWQWPSARAQSMVEPRDMNGLSPYGAKGDRMWVRETWQRDNDRIVFRATLDPKIDFVKWRSPLHLARADARLTLAISEVRIQRVQETTEEDARAEGVPPFFERYDRIGKDQRIACGDEENFLAIEQPHRASYAVMWDEINGDRALWSANPWVWAITFEVVR